MDYTLRIMESALSDTIVIVDETRNGNGVPGSPSDAQVDSFYHSLVTGYPYRDHDYTTNQFVSPYNLRNAGLLIWHADDRSELRLSQNIRVLGEFLDRGGRLILSGWDLMAPFSIQADSANFSTTSFAYRYLHAISARRIPAGSNTGRGFAGDSGFPSVLMDSTKLPPNWHGAMDRLWTFVPRDTTEIIGTLQVTNSGQNPLEGRPAAYLYDGAFRLAVFGVPLYFGITQEVQALMNILLPIMTAPVASPPEALAPVASFALHQNYPNPFNGSTQITFSIPRAGLVSMRVYDVLGRQVAYLGESRMTAGTHRVVFDGSALASGIYFVHLRSEEFSQSRKMVLLK